MYTTHQACTLHIKHVHYTSRMLHEKEHGINQTSLNLEENFHSHKLNCLYTFYPKKEHFLTACQQSIQQQQQKHLLTQIIYKAMIHEYTEYKISKIE